MTLTFEWLAAPLSIYQLPVADAGNIAFPENADFYSVTMTRDEISIVAETGAILNAAKEDAGWRALKLRGVFDMSLTGIMAAISGILAEHGVALFAVSTYNTDYILIRARDAAQASRALTAAGHVVISPDA